MVDAARRGAAPPDARPPRLSLSAAGFARWTAPDGDRPNAG